MGIDQALLDAAPVGLKVLESHASIEAGLEWNDIPRFAILTGKNGAGKSQLLEAIAQGFHAWRSEFPGPMRGEQPPKSAIETPGLVLQPGEAFYARSLWQLAGGGVASEQNIEEALRSLATNGTRQTPPSWHEVALAQAAGVAVDRIPELTPEQLEAIVTPTLLWGRSLPAAPMNLAFLFLAYRMFEKFAVGNGASAQDVVQRYGPPPWCIFDEILESSNLPFRCVPPAQGQPHSILRHSSYVFRLHDVERNIEVPFETLSSGERVIMSMALWLLAIRQTSQHFKLLLLDEPDAHLHPSMTKRFLDVIQTTFVKARGVRVIMTTHSPSTVALAPQGSLFVMRRSTPRILPASSQTSAIASLTEGFVIAHAGMQIVMCEGKSDTPFYQTVWERLTDPDPHTGKSILPRSPTLLFVNGQGKSTVRELVPRMRAAKLFHFHGLIDRDEGNAALEGVHEISRRALENYLLDPINVWCFLHDEDKAPPVEGLSVARGKRERIRLLPSQELQRIADRVLSKVRDHILDSNETSDERRLVSFTNGSEVSYPKWFLDGKKLMLLEAFSTAFPRVQANSYSDLVTSFATLDLVPAELLDLFQRIQTGGADC